MPKFLIERDIPGAGQFTPEQLLAISRSSCSTLRGIDPEVKWITSFVTADKIFCIYIAPDAEVIRRNAFEGGFPANVITLIQSTIDPSFADA
ncbi:DUF4242 domain-containing protein [Tunturiibacter gelidiferens]|uniref:DUF4242 domain-containing protein n=1 Tax=Tunturiibacter gelidiferens TaxID=3069689 RepID=UPI003D9B43D5